MRRSYFQLVCLVAACACLDASFAIADATLYGNTGGIFLGPEDVAPHSLEPQFRKLGMVTSLIRGVPTLGAPHTICSKGDTLNANQVQLLKLFMKPLATVSGSISEFIVPSRLRFTDRID